MAPRVKQLEIRALQTDTPRQEWQDNWERRLGPSQTVYFSFLKSEYEKFMILNCIDAESLLAGQKRSDTDVHYEYASAVQSILAKRCMWTHGRTLRYIKYVLWTRQVKMIHQRKTRRNAP